MGCAVRNCRDYPAKAVQSRRSPCKTGPNHRATGERHLLELKPRAIIASVSGLQPELPLTARGSSGARCRALSIRRATKTPGSSRPAQVHSRNQFRSCAVVKLSEIRLHCRARGTVEIDHVAGRIISNRQITARPGVDQRHVLKSQKRLEERCHRIIVTICGEYFEVWIECH